VGASLCGRDMAGDQLREGELGGQDGETDKRRPLKRRISRILRLNGGPQTEGKLERSLSGALEICEGNGSRESDGCDQENEVRKGTVGRGQFNAKREERRKIRSLDEKLVQAYIAENPLGVAGIHHVVIDRDPSSRRPPLADSNRNAGTKTDDADEEEEEECNEQGCDRDDVENSKGHNTRDHPMTTVSRLGKGRNVDGPTLFRQQHEVEDLRREVKALRFLLDSQLKSFQRSLDDQFQHLGEMDHRLELLRQSSLTPKLQSNVSIVSWGILDGLCFVLLFLFTAFFLYPYRFVKRVAQWISPPTAPLVATDRQDSDRSSDVSEDRFTFRSWAPSWRFSTQAGF